MERIDMQRRGVVIGPMGIGEVLDGAFTLAKRNYRMLVLVTASVAVPSYVAMALAGAIASSSRASLIALSVILWILAIVGLVLVSVATTIACARLIDPEPARVSSTQNRLPALKGRLMRPTWPRST